MNRNRINQGEKSKTAINFFWKLLSFLYVYTQSLHKEIIMAKLTVKIDLRNHKEIAKHQVLRLREKLAIRLEDTLIQMKSQKNRWF